MKRRLAGLLIILLLQTPLLEAVDDVPLGVMRINGPGWASNRAYAPAYSETIAIM